MQNLYTLRPHLLYFTAFEANVSYNFIFSIGESSGGSGFDVYYYWFTQKYLKNPGPDDVVDSSLLARQLGGRSVPFWSDASLADAIQDTPNTTMELTNFKDKNLLFIKLNVMENGRTTALNFLMNHKNNFGSDFREEEIGSVSKLITKKTRVHGNGWKIDPKIITIPTE